MKKGSRGGIYYFYDKDGIADKYVDLLLDKMSEHMDSLIVVSGCALTEDSRKRLTKYVSAIVVDTGIKNSIDGYKQGLEQLCPNGNNIYEEIVLFNNQMMGPVYALAEMFDYMEMKEADFWGLFAKFDSQLNLTYIPLDFLVLRRSLLQSYELKTLLQREFNEREFTNFFEEKGFTWNVYADIKDLSGMSDKPELFYAKELVEKKKCPLFTRKVFLTDYKEYLNESLGQSAFELFRFLKESTCYDVDYILEHLIRCCHQSDLVKVLQLIYVLPVDSANIDLMEKRLLSKSIALVIHIYRVDMAEVLMQYASFMPKQTRIYITTDTEEKKKYLKGKFQELFGTRVEVRLCENRGRDVGSKLVAMKDIIMEYDYVCFIHDKKTPHLKPLTVGEGFGYKCFNDTLYNRFYAYNVLELFENNPRMGIAVPPEPNHANFFTTLGYEWVGNYDNVRKLADKLGLTVPMAQEKEPVAPFGSFFWVRPRALEILYRQDWQYEDFPKEPIADDGTILHAIERIYPFVVQQAGYYPAVIMSEPLARIELTNLRYYVREYNRVFAQHGIMLPHELIYDTLDQCLTGTEAAYGSSKAMEGRIAELERQVAELYPKTSLKWQIADRLKRFFHIEGLKRLFHMGG